MRRFRQRWPRDCARRSYACAPGVDADGCCRRATGREVTTRRCRSFERSICRRHAPAGCDLDHGRLRRPEGNKGKGEQGNRKSAKSKQELHFVSTLPLSPTSTVPRFPRSPVPLFSRRQSGAPRGHRRRDTWLDGLASRRRRATIPPIRLVRNGELDEDVMRLILANVRGHDERRGNFQAQIGSLKTGAKRLLEIVDRRGPREAADYAAHLIGYSVRLMRHAIAAIPDGSYEAEDLLDDDGITDAPISIRVRLTITADRARVDFSGSAPQVAGAINAVEAITVSAVSYVFRCLIGGDVPASAGLMEPIEVIAPPGTVVNAVDPASVAGGNVETSQRIVDVLFKALSYALPDRIPAASQGTMNNLTIGGIDTRSGNEFSYYETVAGGMGARPTLDGMSAVHTHMTNSLNSRPKR